MAKTLLQLTQNILSAMDSDEVSSIYDTVEALQVATIVVETLEAEFSNIDLPSFDRIVKLTSVSDPSRPNYLRYGEGVEQIRWLRYRDNRNRGLYKEVHYLTPSEFFGRMTLNTGNGYNRVQIDDNDFTYWINTNSAPTFYTSVDNDYLIFDSYDSEFEDTLHEANTFALGQIGLDGGDSLSDDYVPPIPNNYFPLLLAEAKATCFLTLKQMPNAKSEQIARRQRSRVQNNRYKSMKADYPYARSKYDYSRKR